MAKQVEKKQVEKKVTEKLDYSKEYEVVGTGFSKHFKNGAEAIVGGEMAELLINKGYANLK
jgi:hypothetical protein